MGSEMCIRDRPLTAQQEWERKATRAPCHTRHFRTTRTTGYPPRISLIETRSRLHWSAKAESWLVPARRCHPRPPPRPRRSRPGRQCLGGSCPARAAGTASRRRCAGRRRRPRRAPRRSPSSRTRASWRSRSTAGGSSLRQGLYSTIYYVNIHLFRATAQKKQQLLSSSQASCMATHSPRVSSAPPPRCQRPPASLQLSRSAPSPIAFAFCARRFPGRAAPTVSRRARRRARPARAALRLPEVWVEPAPAHGTLSLIHI